MTDRPSEEERQRQEIDMAAGPVSAGASNKDAPFNSSNEGQGDQSNSYDQLLQQRNDGTTRGDTNVTSRDLGSAGGGPIPSTGGSDVGGINTSDSIIESGGTSQHGQAGANTPSDRGRLRSTDFNESAHATNTIDPTAQSNLGGRNPGQKQTSLGDQDSTWGNRRDESRTDPMIARTPDKVAESKEDDS